MKTLTLAIAAALATAALSFTPADAQINGTYGSVNRYSPSDYGVPQVYGPMYRHGQYQGTDPDPRIRQELSRDPATPNR